MITKYLNSGVACRQSIVLLYWMDFDSLTNCDTVQKILQALNTNLIMIAILIHVIIVQIAIHRYTYTTFCACSNDVFIDVRS